MATSTQSQRFLALPFSSVRVRLIGLSLIVLLGIFLRFYHLGIWGDGNPYYAAAVKSMLTSWHNFFFVAAEPGGSVTVDKPPLGLWLQALSAFFLGVNGFALALPQALAGVLSIGVLYRLVRKFFGVWPGLLAALVLAITPIVVAAERNNTADGTLVFMLLLAAWAFIKSVEGGQLRYLLLGTLLVGIGFNIKMLQAYLPLPAFYAFYWLGAPYRWPKRIGHLLAATVVLLIVSFSWAVIIDLTPPDARPYIGGSSNNTVINLIFGYNGLGRLEGEAAVGGDAQGGAMPNPMTRGDIGEPGVLRLLTAPLGKEAGWLLPFALFGGVCLLSVRPCWRLAQVHLALVLWGGWLVTEVVFFSVARFFHAYYLIMLGPPLAALTAITVYRLWTLFQERRRLATLVLILGTGATLAVQVSILNAYAGQGVWMKAVIAAAVLAALALLWAAFRCSKRLTTWGSVGLLGALLVTPGIWSMMTTFDPNLNTVLPSTYTGTTSSREPGPNGAMGGLTVSVSQETVSYLQAHTTDMKYLVAVPSSMLGSDYVLETGRPVLFMGGFAGKDNVVTVDQLAQLVKSGQLVYVQDTMGMLRWSKPEIGKWLQTNCQIVDSQSQIISSSGLSSNNTLYDCHT